MPPPVLFAGLDGRSLVLEAPILKRDGHVIEEAASARVLVNGLAKSRARLVVLGPRIPDLSLPETIRRIRSSPLTKHISILALIPAGEAPSLDSEAALAGANAVLRRPLDRNRLDPWIAKLLAVPRRVEARIPVQGHVVGTPKSLTAGHFFGLTRNLSVNGMLLASPVRLTGAPDVDLEMNLPTAGRLSALGRVVREAAEVSWPYLGYGVEFLYVPSTSFEALLGLVAQEAAVREAAAVADGRHGIHSTIRRETWVYEILDPVLKSQVWHVEIRRGGREGWRPGAAGPFYVVEGESEDEAVRHALDFVRMHG
jgi:CheY-like chemotaxis protein